MKIYLALVAIFSVTVGSARAEPTLSEALEKIRSDANLPALGLMLITDGKISEAAMTGTRKWGDPTPALLSDEFHLGSCTKAMTATVFANLVEEGKAKWDSTLGDLFPEISGMDPAFRKVTVEMLTAHRGGLTGDLLHFKGGSLQMKISDPALDPSAGRQLVATELLTSPPTTPPGNQFVYANAGYIIVGRIIEKLTGKSWEKVITERLFRPLGMTSCGFGAPGNPNASPPDQPWPHYLKANLPVPIPPGFYADNPPTYGPAASVHCSMADWGKFLTLHLDGFNHRPTSILTAASFDKLHLSYPGQPYTYGGWIRTTRAWAGGDVLTHEGSNTLNIADVWLAPAKNSALISVTNIGTLAAKTAVDAAISLLIPTMPK